MSIFNAILTSTPDPALTVIENGQWQNSLLNQRKQKQEPNNAFLKNSIFKEQKQNWSKIGNNGKNNTQTCLIYGYLQVHLPCRPKLVTQTKRVPTSQFLLSFLLVILSFDF